MIQIKGTMNMILWNRLVTGGSVDETISRISWKNPILSPLSETFLLTNLFRNHSNKLTNFQCNLQGSFGNHWKQTNVCIHYTYLMNFPHNSQCVTSIYLLDAIINIYPFVRFVAVQQSACNEWSSWPQKIILFTREICINT